MLLFQTDFGANLHLVTRLRIPDVCFLTPLKRFYNPVLRVRRNIFYNYYLLILSGF